MFSFVRNSIHNHKEAIRVLDHNFVSSQLHGLDQWINIVLAWRLVNKLPEIKEVIIDGGRTFFGSDGRLGLYQLASALAIARLIRQGQSVLPKLIWIKDPLYFREEDEDFLAQEIFQSEKYQRSAFSIRAVNDTQKGGYFTYNVRDAFVCNMHMDAPKVARIFSQQPAAVFSEQIIDSFMQQQGYKPLCAFPDLPFITRGMTGRLAELYVPRPMWSHIPRDTMGWISTEYRDAIRQMVHRGKRPRLFIQTALDLPQTPMPRFQRRLTVTERVRRRLTTVFDHARHSMERSKEKALSVDSFTHPISPSWQSRTMFRLRRMAMQVFPPNTVRHPHTLFDDDGDGEDEEEYEEKRVEEDATPVYQPYPLFFPHLTETTEASSNFNAFEQHYQTLPPTYSATPKDFDHKSFPTKVDDFGPRQDHTKHFTLQTQCHSTLTTGMQNIPRYPGRGGVGVSTEYYLSRQATNPRAMAQQGEAPRIRVSFNVITW